MEREKLKKLLREELTKTDKDQVGVIVRKEIKDSEKDLTKRVGDEVKKQLKSNATQKEIIKITADVIENLFKLLWVRRSAWVGPLKNKTV